MRSPPPVLLTEPVRNPGLSPQIDLTPNTDHKVEEALEVDWDTEGEDQSATDEFGVVGYLTKLLGEWTLRNLLN